MPASMVFITRGEFGSNLWEVFKELQHGSDRAVAIVGGSIVERCLELALISHLHRNKKITDQLFRPSGAFGSFATKIHLGLLTGIYGSAGHKELAIVKDIRNKFAHSLDTVGFEAAQISAWAKNLKFGERYTSDMDKVAERDPTFDYKNTPHGDWPVWIGASNRDETLRNPRGRFLLSIQTLTYGLSIPFNTAMPRPHF